MQELKFDFVTHGVNAFSNAFSQVSKTPVIVAK